MKQILLLIALIFIGPHFFAQTELAAAEKYDYSPTPTAPDEFKPTPAESGQYKPAPSEADQFKPAPSDANQYKPAPYQPGEFNSKYKT